MAQNDYQTFGESGVDGTNRLSLTNYIADNDRVYGNSYTTKIVRSQLVNKALQQTSKISAAVAQFITNNGISALDTDSVSTIAHNLENAITISNDNLIHSAAEKTTPVGADEIGILDSASSFLLKKITWADIITALKSTFATLVSPALTGTPTAPTAPVGTNTTQLATTAFVLNSPAFIGTPSAPTATAGDNSTLIANTAFVTTAINTAANNIDLEFKLNFLGGQ